MHLFFFLQLFKDRMKNEIIYTIINKIALIFTKSLVGISKRFFFFFMMIFKSLFNEWGFKHSALVPSTHNPTKNECCMDKFLSTKQWL